MEQSRKATGLLLLLLFSGCELPGKPDPSRRESLEQQAQSFPDLYLQNCAGCHGRDGQLGPARPLNDPVFLALVSTEELERVVRDGRPQTPMPAFGREHGGPLTGEQRKALAAGIKSSWQATSKLSEPAPKLQFGKSDAATSASAERGAEIFVKACAGCHGADGRGSVDNDYHDAINNVSFLNLTSDTLLHNLIITGRADLGMPDYAGADGRGGDFTPLTSVQIDDLVALLSSWRARPAANPTSRN